MKPTLSIAVTADPSLAVPPRHYGGIERVIHLLVERLVERGHRVVLFARRDSLVSCELVPYPGLSPRSRIDTARNAATLTARVLSGGFDIVHSFGRLAYLAGLTGTSIPKIMSYQRPITPGSIAWARRLFGSSIEFTACSRHMIATVESLGRWHVVYNGVPLGSYAFSARVAPDAPLVFLGRLEPEKGAHVAIDIARRTGRRLILAGNVVPRHQRYFDEQIAPHFDPRIEYIGPVDDAGKNALLGKAAALMMPILWDEPFGIVMAEALACGTPVLGFRRASVPEVVRDGVTGFLADDVDGLADAVGRIETLDRNACRADVEARFSDDVIVSAYESLYRAHTRLREPAEARLVTRRS